LRNWLPGFIIERGERPVEEGEYPYSSFNIADAPNRVMALP
jgi:hypothetical protein